MHQVRAAMRAAGAPDAESVTFAIARDIQTSAAIDALWRNHGPDHNADVIAVFAGAKFAHKRWPIESFCELCKLMLQFTNARVILLGGPEDAGIGESLSSSGVSAIDMTGKLNLLETAEILRRCRVYVGNESGPAHLAAAVGTPTVSISTGILSPGVWQPGVSRTSTFAVASHASSASRRIIVRQEQWNVSVESVSTKFGARHTIYICAQYIASGPAGSMHGMMLGLEEIVCNRFREVG